MQCFRSILWKWNSFGIFWIPNNGVLVKNNVVIQQERCRNLFSNNQLHMYSFHFNGSDIMKKKINKDYLISVIYVCFWFVISRIVSHSFLSSSQSYLIIIGISVSTIIWHCSVFWKLLSVISVLLKYFQILSHFSNWSMSMNNNHWNILSYLYNICWNDHCCHCYTSFNRSFSKFGGWRWNM